MSGTAIITIKFRAEHWEAKSEKEQDAELELLKSAIVHDASYLGYEIIQMGAER